MPDFIFLCPDGHEQTRPFPMGKAPKSFKCLECAKKAVRIIRHPKVRIPNWPEWSMPKADDATNKMLESAWNRETWNTGKT